MRRTQERFLSIVAAASLLAIVLAGCDDGGGSNASSGQAAPSTNTPVGAVSLVAWPPVANDAEVVENKLVKNKVIIFDGSGSMSDPACGSSKETKLAVAKRAVNAFVDKIPQEDNVALVAFDGKGLSVRVGLGVGNREKIKQEVQSMQADGVTPLGRSVQFSYEMLTKQAQRQLGYGEYTIIPVTDGEAGDMVLLNSMIKRITAESPVSIHSVGFCIGSGHSLNQKGRTVYREATNQDELTKGLEEVLAEAPSFTVGEFK